MTVQELYDRYRNLEAVVQLHGAKKAAEEAEYLSASEEVE